MKTIKEIEESEVLVLEIEREEMDENGRVVTYGKWKKIIHPYNLGSVKNPNKKVAGIKFIVSEEEKDSLGNIFKGLFK